MNAVNTSAYSMENVRICKKCLLRDLAEEDQKDLKKYLAAIKHEDRASEEVYEMRLGICRKCEKLAEATCEACGCYVEFRAYASYSRCKESKKTCYKVFLSVPDRRGYA